MKDYTDHRVSLITWFWFVSARRIHDSRSRVSGVFLGKNRSGSFESAVCSSLNTEVSRSRSASSLHGCTADVCSCLLFVCVFKVWLRHPQQCQIYPPGRWHARVHPVQDAACVTQRCLHAFNKLPLKKKGVRSVPIILCEEVQRPLQRLLITREAGSF